MHALHALGNPCCRHTGSTRSPERPVRRATPSWCTEQRASGRQDTPARSAQLCRRIRQRRPVLAGDLPMPCKPRVPALQPWHCVGTGGSRRAPGHARAGLGHNHAERRQHGPAAVDQLVFPEALQREDLVVGLQRGLAAHLRGAAPAPSGPGCAVGCRCRAAVCWQKRRGAVLPDMQPV